MSIKEVSSQGASAERSNSSIIDRGWMFPFMTERFLISRDSYRGLTGFWSYHGVKVPGGGCRSLSSVLGKVSGHRGSKG